MFNIYLKCPYWHRDFKLDIAVYKSLIEALSKLTMGTRRRCDFFKIAATHPVNEINASTQNLTFVKTNATIRNSNKV